VDTVNWVRMIVNNSKSISFHPPENSDPVEIRASVSPSNQCWYHTLGYQSKAGTTVLGSTDTLNKKVHESSRQSMSAILPALNKVLELTTSPS
jgi:hypothetical protein